MFSGLQLFLLITTPMARSYGLTRNSSSGILCSQAGTSSKWLLISGTGADGGQTGLFLPHHQLHSNVKLLKDSSEEALQLKVWFWHNQITMQAAISVAPLLPRIWKGEKEGGPRRQGMLWGKWQTKKGEKGRRKSTSYLLT